MTDEAASWDDLHNRFAIGRIDHSRLYSGGGKVYTNGTESFFSRLRRAAPGIHHNIAGDYLIRYAQEASWGEDNRRVDNRAQVKAVMGLAMAAKPSVDWSGYWQRNQALSILRKIVIAHFHFSLAYKRNGRVAKSANAGAFQASTSQGCTGSNPVTSRPASSKGDHHGTGKEHEGN